MSHRLFNIPTVAIWLLLAGVVSSLAGDLSPGQIHPYSPEDEESDRPHQLMFEYPNDGIARAEFRSEEFYAVILKSAERCKLLEAERLELQSAFPLNKVFMNRFGCDNDIEEVITYTNVNPDYSFIAVFAGYTFEEASLFMNRLDNFAVKFPGANIRKMQAVLFYP